MSRWIVIVFVAGVMLAGCGSGGSGAPRLDPTLAVLATKYAPTRVVLETKEASSKAEIATNEAEDARVTPTIPEFTSPVTMMFCEALQQHGQGGAGSPVAIVPDGSRVVYKAGTCEPDVDAAGAVAVRNDDGSIGRVVPEYTTLWPGNAENIVWTPGKGDLHGVPTVFTAKFFEHNATVDFDQLGQPVLDFSMNADGQQMLASLTSRIGAQTNGLPLVTFIDGKPLRGKDGHIIAPRVLGTITDSGQTTGLHSGDAHRIADGINSGMLR